MGSQEILLGNPSALRAIPPTQIPFGHFLLPLPFNVPFLQFPALVLNVSELDLDSGEGPWPPRSLLHPDSGF